jgi:DNA-binding GntR family transcriptional regulator
MKPPVISREVDMKLVPKSNLAAAVYERIKSDIFDFRLLPGDRFTETEVALRAGVSRTPVREALYKLQRDGYIQVSSRNGWSVKPFDFEAFESLYDVRVILELAAVHKVCEMEGRPALDELKGVWLVPPERRVRDPQKVCELDERFHASLVAAAGNPELARIHHEITERIRIIRRLDFTRPDRIDTTYEEHAQILRNVMRRRLEQAKLLARTHIEASKASVRLITLHRLHTARVAHPARRARTA